MSIIHIIKRKFGNRLALLALTLFQTVIISATDKVYISDFSIKPGETKTIAVNFDTDAENTRYIEGYIEIPEGLTVVNQNEGLGTAVKCVVLPTPHSVRTPPRKSLLCRMSPLLLEKAR